MKLLIVDDEDSVRKVTRMSINCAMLGITEVLEADSGIKALKIIRNEMPDIAILDMNMPNMDGVALMQQIEATGIPVKVVVVSGYDSFYYTKQALRYGAVNYILKPINTIEMNETLGNITRELVEHKYGSQRDMMSSFVANVNSVMPPDVHVRDSLVRFAAGHARKAIAVVKLRINDAKQTALSYNDNYDLMLLDAMSLLQKVRSDVLIARSMADVLELYVFFPQEGSADMQMQVRSFCVEAREQLCLGGIRCVFAASVTGPAGCAGEDDACVLLQHCAAVFLYGNLIDNTVLLYSSDPTRFSLKAEYAVTGFNQLLVCAVKLGSVDLARSTAENTFAQIRAQGQASLAQMYELYEDIMRSFRCNQTTCIDKNAQLSEVFASLDYDCIARRITDCIIANMQCVATEKGLKRTCELIQRLVQYITENYNQNISLGMLSKKFYVSREYVCKQFKKSLGITLFDYLRNVRLAHAYIMIKSTYKSIFEIAEETGFYDSSYFIKSFRARYGFTPYKLRREQNQPMT